MSYEYCKKHCEHCCACCLRNNNDTKFCLKCNDKQNFKPVITGVYCPLTGCRLEKEELKGNV